MKKRITDASVKALKPAEKRYRVQDDKREGFLVIVQPNGRKSFYIRRKLDGRRRESKLGDYPSMSVEGARELFDEKVADHRAGDEIRPSVLAVEARKAAKSPENMTLAQLHRHYMVEFRTLTRRRGKKMRTYSAGTASHWLIGRFLKSSVPSCDSCILR